MPRCQQLIKKGYSFTCLSCSKDPLALLCSACIQAHRGHRVRVGSQDVGFCDCGTGEYLQECHTGADEPEVAEPESLSELSLNDAIKFIQQESLEKSTAFANYFAENWLRLISIHGFTNILEVAQFGTPFQGCLRAILENQLISLSRLRILSDYSQPMNCYNAVDNEFYNKMLNYIVVLVNSITIDNAKSKIAHISEYMNVCYYFNWFSWNPISDENIYLFYQISRRTDGIITCSDDIEFDEDSYRLLTELISFKCQLGSILEAARKNRSKWPRMTYSMQNLDYKTFYILPLSYYFDSEIQNPAVPAFRLYSLLLLSMNLTRGDYKIVARLRNHYLASLEIDYMLEEALLYQKEQCEDTTLEFVRIIVQTHQEDTGEKLVMKLPFFESYTGFVQNNADRLLQKFGPQFDLKLVNNMFESLSNLICEKQISNSQLWSRLEERIRKLPRAEEEYLLPPEKFEVTQELCSICRTLCPDEYLRLSPDCSSFVKLIARCPYYLCACSHGGHDECLLGSKCFICNRSYTFTTNPRDAELSQQRFEEACKPLSKKVKFSTLWRVKMIMSRYFQQIIDNESVQEHQLKIPNTIELLDVYENCSVCGAALGQEDQHNFVVKCIWCETYFHYDCLTSGDKFACNKCCNDIFYSLPFSLIVRRAKNRIITCSFVFENGPTADGELQDVNRQSYLRAIQGVLFEQGSAKSHLITYQPQNLQSD